MSEPTCLCPGFWEDDQCITDWTGVPTIYTYCEDEGCGGACEPAGPCPCPLHDTVGEHEPPDRPATKENR